MKKLISMGVLVSVIAILFSCNSANAAKPSGRQPDWINNPKTDSATLYFVGYAEDMGVIEQVKDKAFQNAKGKIANMIFESTEVEKVFSASGSLSDDAELSRSYQETVKSQSAVKLSGVELEEFYTEETDESGLKIYKVWVLAKISRATLEKERQRIFSEIQRKLALVEDNLKKADEYLASGRVIDAVNAYVSAAVSSTKVEERMDEYSIYVTRAVKAMGGLILEPSRNPAQIDNSQEANFAFTLYYTSPSGKVAVPGAKISFTVRNNGGDFTTAGVTDDKGQVVCAVRKLKTVQSGNQLYARLSLDFKEVLDLGGTYSKSYSTLKDAAEKVYALSEFKSISSENRAIPTTVIAMVDNDGSFKLVPALAAEAQTQLIARGYKVVKFNESVSLADINDAKQSALSRLEANGIKRVFVLTVSQQDKPKYNETLERYMGVYSVAAQLIDTATGEIISAKNIKVSATSPSERSVFDAFVKAAGNQLRSLIE